MDHLQVAADWLETLAAPTHCEDGLQYAIDLLRGDAEPVPLPTHERTTPRGEDEQHV